MSKKRKDKPSEPIEQLRPAKGEMVEVKFQNGLPDTLQNGFGEAIGFGQFNPFGMPQGYGFPGTEQLSQTNALFKNLRWYLVSNFRQLLSELYVELGLIQTLVDLPVDDAFKGGVTFSSKQLDEDQLKKLQVSMDRNDDITIVAQGAKWNRLFGGAAVIILTDQDPETPLEMDKITPDANLSFRAVDMWELFWDNQNTEGYDPSTQSQDFEHYNYYGEKLHKSRVMRFKGLEAPSFIRPRLRGWGFSVVEILVRSMNQYLKGTDLVYEVLDEFKLDVYKIKNLVNTLMSPVGEAKIRQRVQMANYQKNYQNAIVMDSEDDFDHKQLSFAGIAEAQGGIRQQVAADMRMPAVKIFGQSFSPGLGNASETEMDNYNSMVEGQVRNKTKYIVLRVAEIRCQELFGFVPDDLEAEFAPLRALSAEQEENVKNAKFNRVLAARTQGEITTFEFREACNKGGLLDITLDNQGDSLNPDDPEVDELVSEGSNDPMEADNADIDDPGTDRKDTKAARGSPKGEYGGKRGEATDDEGKEAPLSKKDPAAKNTIVVMPRPFGPFERVVRTLGNSHEFDAAYYEAEGGDGWVPEGKRPLFEEGCLDKALWKRGEEASLATFGEVKWQFVTWWYKKQGGKF